MTGELDLQAMLATLKPVLDPVEYVYACVTEDDPVHEKLGELTPFAVIRESEGITVILPRQQADSLAIAYEDIFGCITLSVHSSLLAVGLTASVAAALAEHEISANLVAGYYHDHVFVPVEDANRAVDRLNLLSADASLVGTPDRG